MSDYMNHMPACPDCGGDRWSGGKHVCPKVYDTLTMASMARQKVWGDKDPMFAAVELGGEAGELLEQALLAIRIGAVTGRTLNTVKKLERERMGMVGATDTVEALGDELGDVVICCEILARKYGLSLEQVTAKKFNKTSRKYGFDIFMREIT